MNIYEEKIDKKEQKKINGGYVYDKGLFSNPFRRYQVLDDKGNKVCECFSKPIAKEYANMQCYSGEK